MVMSPGISAAAPGTMVMIASNRAEATATCSRFLSTVFPNVPLARGVSVTWAMVLGTDTVAVVASEAAVEGRARAVVEGATSSAPPHAAPASATITTAAIILPRTFLLPGRGHPHSDVPHALSGASPGW